MSKKDDLDHALHNEKVFNHILTNKDFTDWIVTTAFYSALHFVDYKIFPINYNNGKGIKFQIENMESYAISILNTGGKDLHKCRLALVQKKLNPIFVEFSWLFSACKSARYNDYKFPQPEKTCKIATDHLKAIKQFCTK